MCLDINQLCKTFSIYEESLVEGSYLAVLDFASANNCTVIGSGSNALMVATPNHAQDVVVKVVGNGDLFLWYAKGCLNGRFIGPNHLKVYDIVNFHDNYSLVTVERLYRECEPGWYQRMFKALLQPKVYAEKIEDDLPIDIEMTDEDKQFVLAANDIIVAGEKRFLAMDLHDQNIMCREDGTHVLIDPVW